MSKTPLAAQIDATIESMTQDLNDLYREVHKWHSDMLDGARGSTRDLWHLTDIADDARHVLSQRDQLVALIRLTEAIENAE